MSNIHAACLAIEEKIRSIKRTHQQNVRVCAVTKTQGPEVLSQLSHAGYRIFGENRVEHLQMMHAAGSRFGEFHFIGRLQSRQIKEILPYVSCFHSVDSLKHLRIIQKEAQKLNKEIEYFFQINTSGEQQKGGLQPDEIPSFLNEISQFTACNLLGFMCMAPDMRTQSENEIRVRKCFEQAQVLNEVHGFTRLSMGMSNDYELALEYGATDLRIGSAFFR